MGAAASDLGWHDVRDMPPQEMADFVRDTEPAALDLSLSLCDIPILVYDSSDSTYMRDNLFLCSAGRPVARDRSTRAVHWHMWSASLHVYCCSTEMRFLRQDMVTVCLNLSKTRANDASSR